VRNGVVGCRVLELGGMVAAPLATTVLANLGADVIKVEAPHGDFSRRLVAIYLANNVGKRSVVLDLKTADGRRDWQQLLSTADVIVQNLDDEATAGLGVSFGECERINPGLVYCRIRAFGDGPYGGRRATNPVIEALNGLMSVTKSGGKPGRQGAAFYDQMAGLLAAAGVLAALTRREPAGYFEVDLFETGLFSATSRIVEYSMSGATDGALWASAPYDAFQTSEGQWIFLAVLTDDMWRSFCEAMDLKEAGADPSLVTNIQRLARLQYVSDLAQGAISRWTRTSVLKHLESHGIPCAPVNTIADVLRDEHVLSQGKLFNITYEDKETVIPAFPIVGDIVPGTTPRSAPMLGEHNDEILGALAHG
jgi:crotonobetainyl-CoA:carnitine CoA-transferase CaiB-like acyl-CoA transferase